MQKNRINCVKLCPLFAMKNSAQQGHKNSDWQGQKIVLYRYKKIRLLGIKKEYNFAKKSHIILQENQIKKQEQKATNSV